MSTGKDLRLKMARLQIGLTQLELAQAVDLPEQVISRCETGRCTPPTDVQEKIAAKLGKKRWEIFS